MRCEYPWRLLCARLPAVRNNRFCSSLASESNQTDVGARVDAPPRFFTLRQFGRFVSSTSTYSASITSAGLFSFAPPAEEPPPAPALAAPACAWLASLVL